MTHSRKHCQKNFLAPCSTLHGSFKDTHHSQFYDEYIDRSQLTEQKSLFDYIVPSPLERGRNSDEPVNH